MEHALRETPLISCALGCLLKLESLQRTGSFKLRGATAALRALAAEGVTHVVAASAGNHGLGMACAGAALGIAVTVVVPETAVEKKRAGIVAYGAELIVDGAGYDDAERAARRLAAQRGLVFVSPFDDEHVIAGNGGSLAEELLRQRPTLRRVVVPVGGGGLAAGMLDLLAPRGIEVIGVQPRGASAMARSLELGVAQLVDDGDTLCSGLDGGVAERTYARAQKYALRIHLVEEAQVLPAIAYAYRVLGQAVEPASAVVIAAVLGGLAVDGETVLVLTGGNLEPSLLDRSLLT